MILLVWRFKSILELIMLKSITIENYSTFDTITLNFKNPTLIVGANGSGKTNFMRVLYSLKNLKKLDNNDDIKTPKVLLEWDDNERIKYPITFEDIVLWKKFQKSYEQDKDVSQENQISKELKSDLQNLNEQNFQVFYNKNKNLLQQKIFEDFKNNESQKLNDKLEKIGFSHFHFGNLSPYDYLDSKKRKKRY